LSSILGLQPSKTRPFPIKTVVIWVPGIYAYSYLSLPDSSLPAPRFRLPLVEILSDLRVTKSLLIIRSSVADGMSLPSARPASCAVRVFSCGGSVPVWSKKIMGKLFFKSQIRSFWVSSF